MRNRWRARCAEYHDYHERITFGHTSGDSESTFGAAEDVHENLENLTADARQ